MSGANDYSSHYYFGTRGSEGFVIVNEAGEVIHQHDAVTSVMTKTTLMNQAFHAGRATRDAEVAKLAAQYASVLTFVREIVDTYDAKYGDYTNREAGEYAVWKWDKLLDELAERARDVLDGVEPKPREMLCGYCDGVGWTEGGTAIQTTCSRCCGSGVIKES